MLGAVLCYPTCCTRAFIARWGQAVAGARGDLAGLVLRVSPKPPYDWRLNILARYLGDQLIEHFPCTFACEASLDLALRYERALASYEPRHHASIRQRLLTPVLYGPVGVALFPGGALERKHGACTLEYKPSRVQVAAPKSGLGRALRGVTTVRARADGGGARIGTESLRGRLVWFCDGAGTSNESPDI